MDITACSTLFGPFRLADRWVMTTLWLMPMEPTSRRSRASLFFKIVPNMFNYVCINYYNTLWCVGALFEHSGART